MGLLSKIGALFTSSNKFQPSTDACPYCVGQRDPKDRMTPDEFDDYMKALEKIDDLIQSGKSKAALTKIETILPVTHHIDHKLLAGYISDCFIYSSENKKPKAVLALFDKFMNEYQAMDFSIRHGQMEDMSRALSDAFAYDSTVETASELQNVIKFAKQDHVLLSTLKSTAPDFLIRHVDSLAANVFNDWDEGFCDSFEKLEMEIASHKTPSKKTAPKKVQASKTDPASLSCLCVEWKKYRANLQENHPGRLCEHLTEYFSRNLTELPPFLIPYKMTIKVRGKINRGMPITGLSGEVEYKIVNGDGCIFRKKDKTSPWVEIEISGERFVFNPSESRWSNAGKPDKHEIIVEEIPARIAG